MVHFTYFLNSDEMATISDSNQLSLVGLAAVLSSLNKKAEL